MIINTGTRRRVVTSPFFLDPRGRAFPLGLEPRELTIIAIHMGGRPAAELIGAAEPGVEFVPEGQRGTLPTVFGPADQRQIRRWLYGAGGEPPRAERVAELRKRHNLPRDSVADCVLQLIEEGLEEAKAVVLLREWWAHAVETSTAYREPWLKETEWLVGVLRDRRAKEAAR
ncbi:MAG TPA: hypothetical protein VNO79_09125 [Actinomycetota bacterium]|nr:hypothetical protein [Actinomycetota bacterium]